MFTSFTQKGIHLIQSREIRAFCAGISMFAIASFSMGYTSAAWTATASIESNSVTAGVWGTDPEIPDVDIGDLAQFAVYGAADNSDSNNDTITGSNTTIVGGMIGAPRGLLIGSSNVIHGMRTGTDVIAGSNTTIGVLGIVANDDITLGSSNTVNGEVHGDRLTGSSSNTFTGDVVVADTFNVGSSVTAINVDADSAILGSSSHITGTLTLPVGETPIVGASGSVGTLVQGVPQTPDTFTNLIMPAANVFTASSDEDDDVYLDDNSPLTLLPGIYGVLSSNSSVDLTLVSGTYVFEGIILSSSVDITFDVTDGPIAIYSAGNVTTGSNTVTTVVGGDASDVYLESAGVVTLGSSTLWHGTIYSTKSDQPNQQGITTNSNTQVFGGLYSNQRVMLGSTNTITLVGPYFAPHTAPVENNDIVLNEIYPRPAGGAAPSDREWIELYNNSSSAIDVLGWKVSEKSGSTEVLYTIVASGVGAGQMQPYGGADTEIPAGGMLVLEFSTLSGKLNDGGDTVRLYDDTGALRDAHAYPATASGKSHVRIPDGIGIWVDPDPTPGEVNRVSREELIEAGVSEEMIAHIAALLKERGEWFIGEGPGEILDVMPAEIIPEEVIEAADPTLDAKKEEDAPVEPVEGDGEVGGGGDGGGDTPPIQTDGEENAVGDEGGDIEDTETEGDLLAEEGTEDETQDAESGAEVATEEPVEGEGDTESDEGATDDAETSKEDGDAEDEAPSESNEGDGGGEGASTNVSE